MLRKSRASGTGKLNEPEAGGEPTVGPRPLSINCVTDAELVERARGGDTAAFGELVERHQQAVIRAARAAVGDPDEALDAAQDAFIRAFRRLGSFRGDSSFKTWLLTIAWHEALNRRKRVVRRFKRMLWMDEGDQTGLRRAQDTPLVAYRSHEQGLVAVEHAAHLKRLVLALPKRYRDPLLLAATGECTFEEMSRMLGIATGTLKWRVNRARTLLRAELAKLGYRHD